MDISAKELFRVSDWTPRYLINSVECKVMSLTNSEAVSVLRVERALSLVSEDYFVV